MRLEKVVAVLPGAVVTESGVKRALGDRRFSIGDWCWCDGNFVFGHEVASDWVNTPLRRRERFVLVLIKTTDNLHYVVKINTATLEVVDSVLVNVSSDYYLQYFCYNDQVAYIVNFKYADNPGAAWGYVGVFDVYKISLEGIDTYSIVLDDVFYDFDTIDVMISDAGDLLLGVLYTKVPGDTYNYWAGEAVLYINSQRTRAPNASFLEDIQSTAVSLISSYISEMNSFSQDSIEIQDNPTGNVGPLEHEKFSTPGDMLNSVSLFASNVFSGQYVYSLTCSYHHMFGAVVRSNEPNMENQIEESASGMVYHSSGRYVSNFSGNHVFYDSLIFRDNNVGEANWGEWLDFPGIPYQKINKETGEVIGKWEPQWQVVSGPGLFDYQNSSDKHYYITREYPQSAKLTARATVYSPSYGYHTVKCDYCALEVGGEIYDVTNAFNNNEPWSAAGAEEAPAACGVDTVNRKAFIYDGAWIDWFSREKSKTIVAVNLDNNQKEEIIIMPNIASVSNTVFCVLDRDDIFNAICAALSQ